MAKATYMTKPDHQCNWESIIYPRDEKYFLGNNILSQLAFQRVVCKPVNQHHPRAYAKFMFLHLVPNLLIRICLLTRSSNFPFKFEKYCSETLLNCYLFFFFFSYCLILSFLFIFPLLLFEIHAFCFHFLKVTLYILSCMFSLTKILFFSWTTQEYLSSFFLHFIVQYVRFVWFYSQLSWLLLILQWMLI